MKTIVLKPLIILSVFMIHGMSYAISPDELFRAENNAGSKSTYGKDVITKDEQVAKENNKDATRGENTAENDEIRKTLPAIYIYLQNGDKVTGSVIKNDLNSDKITMRQDDGTEVLVARKKIGSTNFVNDNSIYKSSYSLVLQNGAKITGNIIRNEIDSDIISMRLLGSNSEADILRSNITAIENIGAEKKDGEVIQGNISEVNKDKLTSAEEGNPFDVYLQNLDKISGILIKNELNSNDIIVRQTDGANITIKRSTIASTTYNNANTDKEKQYRLVLNNGNEIIGTITRNELEDDHIAYRTASGTITIKRDNIRSINNYADATISTAHLLEPSDKNSPQITKKNLKSGLELGYGDLGWFLATSIILSDSSTLSLNISTDGTTINSIPTAALGLNASIDCFPFLGPLEGIYLGPDVGAFIISNQLKYSELCIEGGCKVGCRIGLLEGLICDLCIIPQLAWGMSHGTLIVTMGYGLSVGIKL